MPPETGCQGKDGSIGAWSGHWDLTGLVSTVVRAEACSQVKFWRLVSRSQSRSVQSLSVPGQCPAPHGP